LTSAGGANDGFVVSRIVTLKCAVAVLLDESVAVHVTAVVPSENVLPLGWSHETVGVPALSVAVTV
jgi:hypothetical protein